MAEPEPGHLWLGNALDAQTGERTELEHLDDVAEIDEKWRAVAAEVAPLEVGLEAADVKAVHTAVVWVRR